MSSESGSADQRRAPMEEESERFSVFIDQAKADMELLDTWIKEAGEKTTEDQKKELLDIMKRLRGNIIFSTNKGPGTFVDFVKHLDATSRRTGDPGIQKLTTTIAVLEVCAASSVRGSDGDLLSLLVRLVDSWQTLEPLIRS